MITSCSSCGHKVWSVNRDVQGWLVRVYFDGEETSETYAEQVTSCPACGRWLVDPTYIGARRLIRGDDQRSALARSWQSRLCLMRSSRSLVFRREQLSYRLQSKDQIDEQGDTYV